MSSMCRCGHGSSLNRRQLVLGAGAGAAALAIGGRSGRSPLTAAAQDKTEIVFWTPGGSPTYCEAHTEIAADYSAENPSVTVNFQCGTDSETFLERFLGSIAAGNPPDASVIWDTPVSLGAQGALEPLDELMQSAEYAAAENWPPSVLASCQFAGQTWGLPVAAGSYGIWYNQELFESKGIPTDRASFPKTWDELRTLSKEFTQWDGDRLVTAGFIPRTPDMNVTIAIWSALNGSQIYDAANQRYTIDAEPNIAMLDYFLAWMDEEYQGDFGKVQRSGSFQAYPSDEGQPPEFQAGHMAMVEWGTWGLGDFYAYGEPAFERYDVAPYPVGPGGEKSVAGYWPNWLAIPKGAHHVQEAFGYLDYMSGVGIIKWFKAVPDTPTNKLVPPQVPDIAVEKRGEEFTSDVMAFFRGQLDVSTPMWDSPVQSFATDQMLRVIERVFRKEATPKDALAEAQQASQAELEKVLAGNA
jgi:multiple sugar transport system substrate-binding protein